MNRPTNAVLPGATAKVLSRRHGGSAARPLALGSALLLATGLHAQAFDRTQAPAVTPPAGLTLPAIQQAKLPNGAALRVVPMHEVPLVQVTLRVKGGGRLDGDLPGLATFTAGMLDEAAGARDGLGIAAEAAFLGAELSVSADWEYLYLSLNTPRRTLGPALDLLADVALRPAFRDSDIRRERDLRLAAILAARDQPNGMAGLAFGAIVYPAAHPYHRPINGDSAGTVRLDSATVRGFYQRVVRPDQAEFIITGDISLAEARTEIGRRFGAWRASRMAPLRAPVPPAATPPSRRVIYLVDKPGAAQSELRIGHLGLTAHDADYYRLSVLNYGLGGSFSSRINLNLREDKGYTYGARSAVEASLERGTFTASAPVKTDVTKESIVELMKELVNIGTGLKPEELSFAQDAITQAAATQYESTRALLDYCENVSRLGWPDDYQARRLKELATLTPADTAATAKRWIHPDQFVILVVGDKAKIQKGLKELPYGEPIELDLDGAPLPPSSSVPAVPILPPKKSP